MDFINAYIMVFVTVPSSEEGEKIARILVNEKLAACVNKLPAVQSFYWWKGKMETSREELLLIKTRKSKLSALTRRVQSLHSYAVPEVISVPLNSGTKEYLHWIDESLK